MATTKLQIPTTHTTGIAAAALTAGANLLSDVIDPEYDRLCNVQLTCTTATGTTRAIELYILYAMDGTNFEVGGTSTDPPKAPVHIWHMAYTASAQRALSPAILLQPYKFKLLLKSELTVNATVTLDVETFNNKTS